MADDRKLRPTTADGHLITSCDMPERASKGEAKLYHALHKAHCARNEEAHECLGRITIDRNGVTVSCPRCGDARKVYAHG